MNTFVMCIGLKTWIKHFIFVEFEHFHFIYINDAKQILQMTSQGLVKNSSF